MNFVKLSLYLFYSLVIVNLLNTSFADSSDIVLLKTIPVLESFIFIM